MGCCYVSKSQEDEVSLFGLTSMKSYDKAESTQDSINLAIKRKNFIHTYQGEISDNYIFLEFLGDGGSGCVHKAIHKATRDLRAIKTIPKGSISQNHKKHIFAEIESLRELDHPNIIRVHEFIEDDKNLHIVTELCQGGELFDRIIKNKSFSENQAAGYMYQIMSALVNCHRLNIVHRDLKPENIMFQDASENSIVKIIDFGTSQRVTGNKFLSNFVGTAYYVAPEVLEGHYDSKCDIWSCGVLLYIMLCGYPPFNGPSEAAIFTKILRGVYSFDGADWSSVSRGATSLIRKMLTKDPFKRPSAEEVFMDPWIQNRAKQLVEDSRLAPSLLNHLTSFYASKKMQQATLAYIASQLTTETEIQHLRKVFVAIDTNGDGLLSEQELEEGFEKCGLSDKYDFQEILRRADLDLNGFIDYTEFLTATLDWKKGLSQDRLVTVFNAYDKDCNGTISIEELKDFLGEDSKVEEHVWQKIIAEVDENGDGVIDLNEFKKAVLSPLSKT